MQKLSATVKKRKLKIIYALMKSIGLRLLIVIVLQKLLISSGPMSVTFYLFSMFSVSVCIA